MNEAGDLKKQLQDEDKKMRMLKFMVDLSQAILVQQNDLSLREAFEIMRNARKAALNLFPGKDDVYDLIYAPRFRRIIRQRFVIPGGRR